MNFRDHEAARLPLSVSADPHHSRENICSKSADGSPQTVQAKLDPPLGAIPVPLEDGGNLTEKRTSDHTPAEAENRNPAFHIKLKIKAGDLFKGCSFVWVTVLHKAQAKISPSFFLFLQACQHGGGSPVPDLGYTLASCCEGSFCLCFYRREAARVLSSDLGVGVAARWCAGNRPECWHFLLGSPAAGQLTHL